MLRIHVTEQSGEISFILEGYLGGRWVAELERCWQSALPDRTGSTAPVTVTVELAGVTFIDDLGRELLCRMRRQGARLVPRGCLVNAIVELIEADACKGGSV